MPTIPDNDKFEISAAVVFRLGDELITDVAQALAELVKNSYDADATWARVNIQTPLDKGDSSARAGLITIEDNGHGMTPMDFRRGWLMIAGSSKKMMKDQGKTTPKGRTPVGDKGLGRLGVQRLGNEITIISRTDNSLDQIKLSFSWKDFTKAEKLSDVPVTLTAMPRETKRNGTIIKISDLKEFEQWTGEGAKNRLQRELSELISPFKEVREFTVHVKLDGQDIPITEIADQIRDSAAVRYIINFDGEKLTVSGKVRLDFCARAQNQKDRYRLKELLEADKGKSFFNFLKNNIPRGAPPTLEFNVDSKWFATFQYTQNLADMGGVRLDGRKVASPGPFEGEVDYLLLNQEDNENSVWDSQSQFKQYVSELSGIRVYRNGFGIRLGEDWLNLGRQQTSGGSMYGLRPKNVIGYISIDASENRSLMETTSREGFQKNSSYINFHNLLQRFVSWSSSAQEYLRRGALDYLKNHRAETADIETTDDTHTIANKLRGHAVEIDKRNRSVIKNKDVIRNITDDASKKVAKLIIEDEQFSLYHQEKINSLNQIIENISQSINSIDLKADTIENNEETVEKAQKILEVILEREEKLRLELSMFYEGVALGLTAEALSHEIANITDSLSKRASIISRHLQKKNIHDITLFKFIEHTKLSIAALRKQISHLDPSLRYVREQRSNIEIGDELSDIEKFYAHRLSRSNIDINIRSSKPLSIVINKGKFNQIIDNLILNSEYWLKEKKRANPDFKPKIYFEINPPKLIVWDNGSGVSTSVESTLFDPFVTEKTKNGRGLGLFIVSQLLDSEGSWIELLPERNAHGRRYKFSIDWSAALYE